MINEDDKKKIRLMTKISLYEKKEGKKNEPITGYFRSDYIGLKILGAMISATIVFGIIVGLYVMCNSETLMIEFYKVDLMEEAKKLVFYYIGFVGVYVSIVSVTFFAKYSKAVRYKRIFSKNLKKLLSHYRGEEDLDDGYDNE